MEIVRIEAMNVMATSIVVKEDGTYRIAKRQKLSKQLLQSRFILSSMRADSTQFLLP